MADKQLLPAQYDRVYMESLVRAIEIHFLQGAEPGDMRAAKMAATQLPTTGGALRDGDIFDDGGILKIIRSGDSYSGTAVGTTAVGTVTISIS